MIAEPIREAVGPMVRRLSFGLIIYCSSLVQ